VGGFHLTARDGQIITAVGDHDLLSTTQLARLFWGERPGSAEVSSRCRLRLRLLTAHGYLQRIEQPVLRSEGRRPWLYTLGPVGADFLCQLREISRQELGWSATRARRSALFLEHQLALSETYVSLALATPTVGVDLADWIDDRQLRRDADTVTFKDAAGVTQQMALVPDAFFQLRMGKRVLNHFVEIDRSTVTLLSGKPNTRTWQRKVRAYMAYYRSGDYARRFGHTRSLRVLTLADTPARALSMKAVAEAAGGGGRFWFASARDATVEQILTASIWCKAGSGERLALLSQEALAAAVRAPESDEVDI